MQGEVVELTEADAADVSDLYARCIDYFLLQDGASPTLSDAYKLFTDVPPEKEPRDQTVLGWKKPNGLDAVAAILRDYPCISTWYLGFMIVDAAVRGRGVGRSIYAMIEAWAEKRGAKEVRLAVLETNDAGERFWQSLGFEELQRVGPDQLKARTHYRIELSRSLNGEFGKYGNTILSKYGDTILKKPYA